MAKKKSYSPFKMWGSWVGLVLFTIPIFMWAFGAGVPAYLFPMSFMNLADSCIGEGISAFSCSPVWIPFPILGFLLGWGIHSLIRRLK